MGSGTDTGSEEWQCTACGFVVAPKYVDDGRRPSTCPECRSGNEDRPTGVWLFVPREVCGRFGGASDG